MDPVTLAWWRNMATLLLVVEIFVMTLPLLIGLFFAVRGMGVLRAKLAAAFVLVRERTAQVEGATQLASNILVTPPIRVRSAARGVAGGARALMGGKR